ncbi:MAG: hypothetical protein J0H96_05215 [Microbacterium ginsengisoli]|nr:hypothetical protein [Microbacterium ginsengisoli]
MSTMTSIAMLAPTNASAMPLSGARRGLTQLADVAGSARQLRLGERDVRARYRSPTAAVTATPADSAANAPNAGFEISSAKS